MTKRKAKKIAVASAGVLAVTMAAREIKVSNTYMYARARYNTLPNYRDSPFMEVERRHMKHRQRAKAFGSGRSTFQQRRKRQAYQRNMRNERIKKLGVFGYAYKMSRNNIRYDPIVQMTGSKIQKIRTKNAFNKMIKGL